jgi:hypothetical protein
LGLTSFSLTGTDLVKNTEQAKLSWKKQLNRSETSGTEQTGTKTAWEFFPSTQIFTPRKPAPRPDGSWFPEKKQWQFREVVFPGRGKKRFQR